ncbi:hypothetical protein CCM_02276 [Cordyceps militaris CM01]|uniref:Uncharacterized protein n=1 Tax=Cordyceps militaris (strain CM01) TaxID=983644 RepID=G3J8S0_CORMM|nr:uncharacterized protein CCM_02276 [Cordyceps militaris CM01]EGX94005.1 hypothetical protein CCM_02276 [Cordyceps militaris CM01]
MYQTPETETQQDREKDAAYVVVGCVAAWDKARLPYEELITHLFAFASLFPSFPSPFLPSLPLSLAIWLAIAHWTAQRLLSLTAICPLAVERLLSESVLPI